MHVEQVGVGGRQRHFDSPGEMSPGSGVGSLKFGGRSGLEDLFGASFCSLVDLLLPPGHTAYTCTCWLRTTWPWAQPVQAPHPQLAGPPLGMWGGMGSFV